MLTWDGSVYDFAYLRAADSVPDFRPLLGFPAMRRLYRSPRLFPLFAQRVMNHDRPDYGRYLQALDLELTASKWELLARSEGRREGDSVLVFPEPVVAPDGASYTKVLVHGIRHLQKANPQVEQCLRALRAGDRLDLVEDPTNKMNPRAMLVADSGQVPLGYFPDLLLGYLHHLRERGAANVSVERVNPPETPPHLRLLINVRGDAGMGYVPFSGTPWELNTGE
ncbi:MAG: hypothetical protein WCP28_02460 [Actinomycetes bacterium]